MVLGYVANLDLEGDTKEILSKVTIFNKSRETSRFKSEQRKKRNMTLQHSRFNVRAVEDFNVTQHPTEHILVSYKRGRKVDIRIKEGRNRSKVIMTFDKVSRFNNQ